MNKKMAITIRQKKLGLLLRDARIAAGKNKKDCAEVLGVSTGSISSIEQGRRSLSLPELERLAYFLQVPFSHFWNEDIRSKQILLETEPISEINLVIRDRGIGRTIAEIREKAGLTYKEIQEHTGITSTRMHRFEAGEAPIPVPELEMLCGLYKIGLIDLVDDQNPAGRWILEQRTLIDFMKLPPHIQEFVCKPINRPFIELAQKLSALSTEELRGIAEGLLEITI